MKILIACEFSGIVRDAFIERGHHAISCDLLPSEKPGPHRQQNVLNLLNQAWDLMIAFPPCQYLCASGQHWNGRHPGRLEQTMQSLNFVRALMQAPIERIAIENPIGIISTQIKKPSQIIQPYQFGENASKKTCLWLKNLPMLEPTKYIKPRIVNGMPRWDNQTDSGQNKLSPAADRWKNRSRTYAGIAAAMAEQWGVL